MTERDASSPSVAPTDDGVPLATIDRGPNKELRIRWREYRGFHFVDVHEWWRRREGDAWRPSRPGVTIKQRELRDVIDALRLALKLSAGQRPDLGPS